MANEPTPAHHELHRQRYELLSHLLALTERPLVYLSFVWVALILLTYLHHVNRLLAI